MFKRLFRVYGHIYHSHFDKIVAVGAGFLNFFFYFRLRDSFFFYSLFLSYLPSPASEKQKKKTNNTKKTSISLCSCSILSFFFAFLIWGNRGREWVEETKRSCFILILRKKKAKNNRNNKTKLKKKNRGVGCNTVGVQKKREFEYFLNFVKLDWIGLDFSFFISKNIFIKAQRRNKDLSSTSELNINPFSPCKKQELNHPQFKFGYKKLKNLCI